MKRHAKKNTQSCAAERKQNYFYAWYQMKFRNMQDCKKLWVNPHICCYLRSNQRRKNTWYQCRIIHNTHTHNFHSKNRSSHRCPKNCRKGSAHPTHNNNAPVLLIKPEPPSKLVPNASAKLERRPLTPRRTAKKMRQNCRYKN